MPPLTQEKKIVLHANMKNTYNALGMLNESSYPNPLLTYQKIG